MFGVAQAVGVLRSLGPYLLVSEHGSMFTTLVEPV
jgi:hypothetical protein